jgi:hypothetical protein
MSLSRLTWAKYSFDLMDFIRLLLVSGCGRSHGKQGFEQLDHAK